MSGPTGVSPRATGQPTLEASLKTIWDARYTWIKADNILPSVRNIAVLAGAFFAFAVRRATKPAAICFAIAITADYLYDAWKKSPPTKTSAGEDPSYQHLEKENEQLRTENFDLRIRNRTLSIELAGLASAMDNVNTFWKARLNHLIETVNHAVGTSIFPVANRDSSNRLNPLATNKVRPNNRTHEEHPARNPGSLLTKTNLAIHEVSERNTAIGSGETSRRDTPTSDTASTPPDYANVSPDGESDPNSGNPNK